MYVVSELLRKVRAVRNIVRSQPFGDRTAGERERERYRRVALTAMASGAAKCISVATALVTVPLTLQYLGVERYGLWMSVSSFVALLGFSDCGLGNGLVNAISESHAREDHELAARNVSSVLFMLCAIALGLGCLWMIAFPLVPWDRVFNVTTAEAVKESGPAVFVLAVCFLAGLPLSVVSRVQSGYQEGFQNSAWQAIGNVVALVAVVTTVNAKGGLPWLVGAMTVPPLISTLLNGIHLFWVRRPWLRPSWRFVTTKRARALLRVGGFFFVLQLTAVVTFASDTIIIAQVCGAAMVPEYSVPMRLFSLAPMAVALLVSPLWPAYGEAVVRGDVGWINRTLVRSLTLSVVVTGCAGLVLVMFGHGILRFWVGPAVTVSTMLLVGMSVWTVMSSAGESVAMLMNGTNSIRFEAVTGLVTCCAAVTAKIVFGRMFGLEGVVFGTVLAYGVFAAVPLALFIPKLLRDIGSGVASRANSAARDQVH